MNELKEVYRNEIAENLYAIALLRSINPKMTNNKIEEVYEESFISVDFQNLKLGKMIFLSFKNDRDRLWKSFTTHTK
ncbi:hypothetical protein NO343_00130 [Mycoplasma capricolum subsp. capricolum]|nr:hypothetical protein [Mycoplasma capricolum]WBX36280.1 hypothetical protein NO343_00130 [Mycoplasma capricolum subsp. capricolum]